MKLRRFERPYAVFLLLCAALTSYAIIVAFSKLLARAIAS